ncbi:hypothetical protein EDB81DRAFT_874075 [Dactylonectria macrodidyma]|uniref:2EXR domain-containing protein n=1 Tax=Dactylonectria macrodidyma TaxID=307937 RepID=A0A9P9FRP1_9HYPO|nr:hypothetical protein EDB81DRAFT_874075 [Dactylonectria macrodidyma]
MQTLFVDSKLEMVRYYKRQRNTTKSTSVILGLDELCCESLGTEDVAASFISSIETVVAELRQPGIVVAAQLPELLYKFLLKKYDPPDIATRLGLSREKAGQEADAKKTYEKLFAICKKQFGIGDVKIAFAADYLAGILQQEGSTSAAIELYRKVFESRREAFGVSSASTIELGLRLAQFYVKASEILKAVSLYVEMLNSLERDWGKSFTTTVEVSLALASVYKSQPMKAYKGQELCEGLWSFCLREKLMNANPDNDKWKLDPGTVINLRNKLYKLYGTQKASVKFCCVAREYRQMYLESYGDGHREHIIATLRNAIRLTRRYKRDKSGSNRSEAVRETLWSSQKSREALSRDYHTGPAQRLAKCYMVTDQTAKLDNLCAELYKYSRAQKIRRQQQEIEKMLKEIYTRSGMAPDEAISRLDFAEGIRNAALDQPSTQPPTKEQLDALQKFRNKSHPSQCMIELWAECRRASAGGESMMDDSFPLFPHLSPEIRASIWKTSLWTPSIVQLCFHSDDPLGYEMSLKHRVIPPLLHVCSESRHYAQKMYPDVFAKQKDTSIMTYMNLEIDTLYIGTASRDVMFEWIFEALTLSPGRSLNMDDVKHFAFEIDYWRNYGTQNFLPLLSSFSNLKSLTLVIEDDAPSSAPAKLVDLNEDELGQETAGLGYSDGVPDYPIFYRDFAENIQTAYENMLDDERGLESEYRDFEGWSLPELRLKKLVGHIIGKKMKEPHTGS